VRMGDCRTIGSTAFDLVYGYPLESAQDPFLVDTKVLMDNIMKAAMPSSEHTLISLYAGFLMCCWLDFLVNAIPWLAYVPKWFPGAGWKKTALEWRDQKDELTDVIYNWTKNRVVCFVLPASHEFGLRRSCLGCRG
jgi:hypothetical protein